MILDSINNAERYYALLPRLEQVFNYLATTDLKALEVGRHDIMGDELFVNVSELELRPLEAAHLEVHNRYLDVQVVVEGEEYFGWSERKDCKNMEGEFDTERMARVLLDEYRSSKLGKFTLEIPEEMTR